jgi:peptide/nickel transport system substrate-binding protein
VRFEHYFETDAEGNSLPYLDGIAGRTKQEDRVRLTSLRAGEVDLIDTMAYADAATFTRHYAEKFQTWDVPMLGTSYILFNVEKGPFADKRLRQAAAHAIDHDAIHEAVFHGRGDLAHSFYSAVSPWYTPKVKPYPEYDPDKARFLLRQARATGTEIALVAQDAYPYLKQTGELVQAMWTEVGFTVQLDVYSAPILQQKRRERDFHAESTSAGYRFDPDRWFSTQLLSTAPSTQQASGFRHAPADELITAARQTADKAQRLAYYADMESLVNDELPLLYLHHLTLLEAGVLNLKGYQPAIAGAFTTQGSGIRTAWLA